MITKYSLIGIVVGLLGLYLISNYIEPEFVNLQNINEMYLNKIILTSGKVKNIFLANTTLFLVLENNQSKINVVYFNAKNINFKKNDNVIVKGEVILYKNKLEIIAREIRLIY